MGARVLCRVCLRTCVCVCVWGGGGGAGAYTYNLALFSVVCVFVCICVCVGMYDAVYVLRAKEPSRAWYINKLLSHTSVFILRECALCGVF